MEEIWEEKRVEAVASHRPLMYDYHEVEEIRKEKRIETVATACPWMYVKYHEVVEI